MTEKQYVKAYFLLEEYVPEFQQVFKESYAKRQELFQFIKVAEQRSDLDVDAKIELAMMLYNAANGIQDEKQESYEDDAEDLYSLNGCGTTHYGKFDVDGDVYSTICWIAVFFIPLIPYKAYRIRVTKRILFFHTRFEVISKVPMRPLWVIRVYLSVALILGLLYCIHCYYLFG